MKCATHITYGVLTGMLYAISFTTDINMAIASVSLATLGSLIPDIDSKSSKISNILIFPKVLPLKHRGFMHSITLATIVTVINVPIGIGMFSHIALDLLNHQKIKLFAPLSNKRFALKLCKSDGIIDQALRVVGTGAILLVLLT